MSCSFVRTSRSVGQELSENTALYVWLALIVMATWGVWMTFARVPLFTGSTSGRLEVTTTTRRAATPSSGRVVQFSVRLGDVVQAQEVLLGLDDSVERRRLNEAIAAVSALDLRVQAVEAQRRAEEQVRAWQARAYDAAVAQSRASLAEVNGDLVFRQKQADMAQRLKREALISTGDALVQAQGLSKALLEITSSEAGLEHERVNGRHADHIQAAKIADVERQLADLEAARITAFASVETAKAEVAKKVVTAPIGGRIGSLAAIQVGDVLEEGSVVATVVPEDPLRVVAEFEPSMAVGRIRCGQAARVRLSGFSLVEFGRFDAEVSEVASEPQGGTIRVELSIAAKTDDFRLQHGVPAMVEVRIDSASPFQLVLRALGEMAAPRRYELPAGDARGASPPLGTTSTNGNRRTGT